MRSSYVTSPGFCTYDVSDGGPLELRHSFSSHKHVTFIGSIAIKGPNRVSIAPRGVGSEIGSDAGHPDLWSALPIEAVILETAAKVQICA